MLANPTTDDTEVITQLGDSVRASWGACAAHCCYLLAETPLPLPDGALPHAEQPRLQLIDVGQDARVPGLALGTHIRCCLRRRPL